MNGCPNCGLSHYSYQNPTDAGPELELSCEECGCVWYEPNPQSSDYRDARDEAEHDHYARYW